MSQAAAFEALPWVLIHFVWQGFAIAAILAVALFLLRCASPAARYAACCGALALEAIVPLITFAWTYISLQQITDSPFSRLGDAHPSKLSLSLSDRMDAWLAYSQPYLPRIVSTWSIFAA